MEIKKLLLSDITAAPISLHGFLLLSEGAETSKFSALHMPLENIQIKSRCYITVVNIFNITCYLMNTFFY